MQSAWCRHGALHRDGDLPAWVGDDGQQEWYREGLRHRDNDAPALLKSRMHPAVPVNVKEWWVEGKCHRDGGPAVIRSDGTTGWYSRGLEHRDGDLPAVEGGGYDSWTEWWVNGKLHRETGPARDPHNFVRRLEFYVAGHVMPDLPTLRMRWRLASAAGGTDHLRLSLSNEEAWSWVVDNDGLSFADDGSEFEVDPKTLAIALAIHPNVYGGDDNWKPIAPQ
jgi:hypothetical protein